MFGLVPCLSAVAAIGGCTPATPPGYVWDRAEEPGQMVLTLTAPYASRPTLTMTCEPASGAIDMTLMGWRANGAIIELRSGKLRQRYGGAGLADAQFSQIGLEMPLPITARLNAADPVLAAFADTGKLIILQGDARLRAPNAFAPAHDFLAACRTR